MKKGIIDCGTNTFNLLVVEKKGDDWKVEVNVKVPVRLGEGGINKGFITAEAIERGVNAIEEHLETALKHDCSDITAFATSAVRSASNGNEFVDRVEEEFGLEIQVIDGTREAELIYAGVKRAVSISEPSIIMDIGGGSTEFILCDGKKSYWAHSFDLGAARLLERFGPSDPIPASTIKEVRDYLMDELSPLREALKAFSVDVLIGSSGSFDTFADIRDEAPLSLENAPEERDLTLEEFDTIYKQLLTSTREQRMAIPGMIPLRVNMIVLGAIFTQLIIEIADIKTIKVSAYAMKEGMLSEFELND